MKSVLDPTFRYTPSVKTDLRKTFARIRRREREMEAAQLAAEAEAKTKVLPIDGQKKPAGPAMVRL